MVSRRAAAGLSGPVAIGETRLVAHAVPALFGYGARFLIPPRPMDQSPSPATPHRRAALTFIFVTVLLDMLAFGIIIPVLPHLIVQLRSAATSARRRSGSACSARVFMLMQFVFSPIQGALSDRFGRRPVILMSCLGLGLDFIVMALAPMLLAAVPRPRACPASAPRASPPPMPTSPTSRRAEKRARGVRHARRCVRPRLHHRPGARRLARRICIPPAVLGRGRRCR